MPALTVIEAAVVTFGHHGCERIVANSDVRVSGDHPVHHPVGHARDIEGAGQGDGVFQKPGFSHPGQAGHLAGAVQHERPGRHFLAPDILARNDHGDTGADRPFTGLQRALPADQG